MCGIGIGISDWDTRDVGTTTATSRFACAGFPKALPIRNVQYMYQSKPTVHATLPRMTRRPTQCTGTVLVSMLDSVAFRSASLSHMCHPLPGFRKVLSLGNGLLLGCDHLQYWVTLLYTSELESLNVPYGIANLR